MSALDGNLISLYAALSSRPQAPGVGLGKFYRPLQQQRPGSGGVRPHPSAPNQPFAQSIQRRGYDPYAHNPFSSTAEGFQQGNDQVQQQQRAPVHMQGQPISPDLAGPLAKAHGLGDEHAPILQALLSADPTGKSAVGYAQHAATARQQAPREAGQAELDEAKARELNQKTAAGYEAQNAYGAGGLKGHEADLRLQGQQQSTAVHAAQEDLNRWKALPLEQQLTTPEPSGVAAASPSYGNGDLSREGQAQLQHIQNQMNPLANGVPPGNGATAPDALIRQVHSATGNNAELTHKLLTEAGWK